MSKYRRFGADDLGVNVDLGHVIDDNTNPQSSFVRQDMREQCRFS